MTLLNPRVEPTKVNELDAEALIREARRLRRRRWIIGCLVVVLVIGGIVAGLVASGGTGRPARRTTLAFRAGGPTVDAKAFAGEGDLAFVSRGTVYVLDGAKPCDISCSQAGSCLVRLRSPMTVAGWLSQRPAG